MQKFINTEYRKKWLKEPLEPKFPKLNIGDVLKKTDSKRIQEREKIYLEKFCKENLKNL